MALYEGSQPPVWTRDSPWDFKYCSFVKGLHASSLLWNSNKRENEQEKLQLSEMLVLINWVKL